MESFEIDYAIPEDKIPSKKTPSKQREYVKKIKYDKIVSERVSSFKDIVGVNLEKNTQYRFVTNKSFNAVTVLSHIIKFNVITEMYIVVYRMNNISFDLIKNIIETDNIKCGFIISTFFMNNKKYEKWVEMLKVFSNKRENANLAFIHNHAKIFLAKTNNGNHFVFEGSGNLSDNAMVEQYIYEDNKSVYNFHKDWIEKEF